MNKVPYFFSAVFGGAFSPKAIFGGVIGTTILQGVKRGLMSNEAGQGTITMAAAISHNDHPCEQGLIQSLGVFLDTMIICTMTGFIIIMAHIWDGNTAVAWNAVKDSKLDVYILSVGSLVPGLFMDNFIKIILCFCYAMFAFTTLIGLISFSEIASNRISQDHKLMIAIRATGAFIMVPFGALTVLAGLELGNLWYISDFTNILLVYANVPVIIIGFKYVAKATKHYMRTNGGEFTSDVIGMDTEFWGKSKNKKKNISSNNKNISS